MSVAETKQGKELMTFIKVFPQWTDEVVTWTPNKDGSIRVELTGKRFFIFSYWDERTWRLETVRAASRRDENSTAS
jgi:hypothetical protein